MRTVYLDGRLVPEAEAKLSIYDLSVMQACAAFEMTRSFHGEHFRLGDHLRRLQDSCATLSIPCDWTVQELDQICEDVTVRNPHGPGEEHRLLLVVSPGCAPMYKDLDGVMDHPFLYIADFPLRYTVAGFGRYFTEGVHCSTSNIQQVPDACIPSAAKHRSRLHFHLAQQQAPPGTWPLVRDLRGFYCEAPGANLVQVSDGLIRPITTTSLPGISLQTVRELVETENGAWHYSYTPQLDELWLTGTPFCMLPVVSLDGTPIGDGQIGPVYRETLAKWNALVGLDIARQICDWDEYGPGPSNPEQYQRWAADKDFLRGKVWTPDAQRLSPVEHRTQ